MKGFECKRAENCFSQSAVYQYRMERRIDDAWLAGFEQYGTVQCQRNLPRPFFKIRFPDGVELKGIIGDLGFRAAFPPDQPAVHQANFEQKLRRILGETAEEGRQPE